MSESQCRREPGPTGRGPDLDKSLFSGHQEPSLALSFLPHENAQLSTQHAARSRTSCVAWAIRAALAHLATSGHVAWRSARTRMHPHPGLRLPLSHLGHPDTSIASPSCPLEKLVMMNGLNFPTWK